MLHFAMPVVARLICNVVARQLRKNLNRPAAYINMKAYKIGGLASMYALDLFGFFLV